MVCVLLERISKVIMTIAGMIGHVKLQFDIHRKATDISELSPDIIPSWESIRKKKTKKWRSRKQKQAKALESLKFFNKTNELKQVGDKFPNNQLTYLIIDRLKWIMELHNSMKMNDSSTNNYSSTNRIIILVIIATSIFKR